MNLRVAFVVFFASYPASCNAEEHLRRQIGAFEVASAVVTEEIPSDNRKDKLHGYFKEKIRFDSYVRESENDSKEGFKDEEALWSRLMAESMSMTPAPIPGNPCIDVDCLPPEVCEPTAGTCKPLEQVIPCVAVIDEWDSLSDPNPLWVTFRTNYTTRPFCLLTPTDAGVSYDRVLPTAYDSDNLSPDGMDRTIYQNVTRDEGIATNASDWFTICGLDIYRNGTVPFVGLFIDNSGSMTTSTVQASYDKFLAEIATAGLTISLVENTDENWILPFLTELAPPTP